MSPMASTLVEWVVIRNRWVVSGTVIVANEVVATIDLESGSETATKGFMRPVNTGVKNTDLDAFAQDAWIASGSECGSWCGYG